MVGYQGESGRHIRQRFHVTSPSFPFRTRSTASRCPWNAQNRHPHMPLPVRPLPTAPRPLGQHQYAVCQRAQAFSPDLAGFGPSSKAPCCWSRSISRISASATSFRRRASLAETLACWSALLSRGIGSWKSVTQFFRSEFAQVFKQSGNRVQGLRDVADYSQRRKEHQ